MLSQNSGKNGVANAVVSVGALTPHPRNYNQHSQAQVGDLRRSLRRFGQVRSIVVQAQADPGRWLIVAGHGIVAAAKAEGMDSLRADIIPADWDDAMVLAYLAADNELARQGQPDEAQLAALLRDVQAQADRELAALAAGSEARLTEMLATLDTTQGDAEPQIDRAAELLEKWQVRLGDLWRIGEHRLACGDCREPETWGRLLAGAKANGVFTSPPYAEQRKEQYGGVPTAEYVDWWEAVQANVKAHLAHDGSFFVNIKPHCEDGERVLYVFDLVLAMKRRWGWRFEDEFIWRHGGTPKRVQRKFKNQFEPIYHFGLQYDSKFKPESVRHSSNNVPVWDEKRGLKGAFKASKEQGTGSDIFSGVEEVGLAYPGNVIESGFDSSNQHAAAFPVALPDFFIRAYSDVGDVWIDPFCGSGTTIVAAHNNRRIGMGIEQKPEYCAVVLQRMSDAFPGIEIERLLPRAKMDLDDENGRK